ncbi:PQQ-dependent sugar dehydrogenase [Rheinheimera nanhaiensis]|uniref:Glucose sorbosone dehydrogenase n=1 Tax=Rheinheimera nanhaiensis E407-8 TaxID=562729 RepID=I1DX59_9GAMM|nr:PQQ-dependent sugar dehydrogenase [Rheinheimera nanhaiensis]GAB58637.1 glucose sorbosone dehydrogenase [Rheinheimera nanhaiensis E407-8]
MLRFSALLLCWGLLPTVLAQPYQLQVLADKLHYPWALTFLPDGDMLLTERSGTLKRLSPEGDERFSIEPDLPDLLKASQAGLQEVTLTPDFATSQRIILSYACGTLQANNTCLVSAELTDAGLSDIKKIFQAQPLKAGAAHFGGRITWLADHSLVLTLGDGFDYREQAQNPANHLGKLVRLHADGSVPADNPYVAKEGYAPELYSLGHRNVQGIFYDAASQTLYSHEHGPRGGDELNIIRAGANYGWPVATEGIDYTGARISPFSHYDGMQPPVWGWSPSIAPAGMTLYRGSLFRAWQGNIFVAALAGKSVRRLVLENQQVVQEQTLFSELQQRIRDVRTGPDGALYLLTDSQDGQLIKVLPAD